MSEHFDAAAKDWDKADYRHERARLAAKEILSQLKDPSEMNVLEFGCGTGLLSFCMNSEFKSVTLLDSSPGMIREVEEKIQNNGITNCESKCFVLEKSEQLTIRYDAVYSILVFHHISDYEKLLALFHHNLAAGGKLFILDLEKEDGSFHRSNPDFDGHNGFDVSELARKLGDAGFRNVRHKVFYRIRKEIDGEMREYPLFILSGEK